MFDKNQLKQFLTELINPVIDDSVKRAFQNYKPEQEPEENQFISIDEAARFLSLSKYTLYGMTSRGEIEFFKRGKRLYFDKEILVKYLKDGRQKTNEELKEESLDYLLNRRKGGKYGK